MTENLEIPKHLRTPATEKSDVSVPIDMIAERSYSAEQVTQLAVQGGIVLDGNRLKALHDVGMAAEQLGALRTYKGGIVVTLNGLVAAISQATKVVEDETDKYSAKEKMENAKVLGYLSDKLSKLTTGAVKMDRDVAEVVMEADARKRQSFAPGQRVTVNRGPAPVSS